MRHGTGGAMKWWGWAIVLACGLPGTAAAQAPGVPIEAPEAPLDDPGIIAKAQELRKTGKALDVAQAKLQLKKPEPETLKPLEVRNRPLPGREIAALARKAFVRIGWFGPDAEGVDGFSLGAAYAISADGVFVTCRHCVAPLGVTEGHLMAIDGRGEVLPVVKVLAANRFCDTALIRIEGGKFEPLPLQTNLAPGDDVYCLSDPLEAYGYFARGIANRFHRLAPHGRKPPPADSPWLLRLDVSTDWAPGSSGAAVLDACGNAVGHVAVIQLLTEGGVVLPPEAPAEGAPDAEKPAPGEKAAEKVQEKAAEKVEEKAADKAAPEQPKRKKREGKGEGQGKPAPEGAAAEGEEKEKAPEPQDKPKRGRLKGRTMLVLHEAVPVAPVLRLIEEMNAAKAAPAK